MQIAETIWILTVALVWLGLAGVAYLGTPPVPTRKREMDIAFELAQLKSGELAIDLGAGDGRFLQVARDRYKALIRGWELHPLVWLLAKLRLGFDADVRLENLWRADVSQAEVVFVFLMPKFMGRVEEELWTKMKPGARLVANFFALPNVAPTASREGVHLYIKK